MGSDRTYNLGNFVSLQRGTTYKGDLVGKPGPVLLGLASIKSDGGFRWGAFKTYGGECPKKITLKSDDVYVSLKDVTQSGDLLGSVARVPKKIGSGRLTQDTVKLVFSGEAISQSYIYWLLRTPEYRAYCRSRATGTTTLGLAREDFLNFPVLYPTVYELSLIEILEAIEVRIELLGEANATLEAIAQALFKSWFVDFDPVRAKAEGRQPEGMDAATAALFPDTFEDSELGPIPKGWEAGVLGDIAETTRKQLHQDDLHAGLKYVGLEHIPRKSLSLSGWGDAAGLDSAKSAFSRGDILFGKLRPYFHKVVVSPFDGVCSTDILVCRAKSPSFYGLAMMHLFSESLIDYADRLSNGAKMPRVNWKDIADYPVCLPPSALAEEYSTIIRPLVEKMLLSAHESKVLSSTRDAILPRLTSGQPRLPEAPELLEEAEA